MTKKLIPELRFPEFTDEWQVNELSSIADVSSGGTPTRTNSAYWGGSIPWVTTSEINFNTIYEVKQYITEDGLRDSAAKIFPSNSILVALYGQGATRGKVAKLGIEAATNQACAAIMPDTTILDVDFLFHNLSSRYDFLRNLSNNGSQKNLNGQLIKQLSIHTPTLAEQTKISSFLTIVNDKVIVTQRKVALLKEYKRGTIQKIFAQQPDPKNEDKHKHNYSVWRETRLGDILKPGAKIPVPNTSDYRKITIGLDKRGLKFVKPSREMADTRPFYIRRAGEIIIGKQNFFSGSIAIVGREFDGTICSNAIMSFEVQKNNTKFVYEYISTPDFLNKRGALANGTGQKELSETAFLDFKVYLPQPSEQQKIADFLTSLDDKIKAEETKLEQTKLFKDYLLQRMFV